MPQAETHRADIDGLRGVGVLAALASVVAPNWVPGGLAGLDMLFVVAGFLVTSTILDALTIGNVDLRAWYGRRLRRTVPAILVVMIVLFVAGWFLLFAGEYRELGRDMAGGALVIGDNHPARLLLNLRQVALLLPFYVAWPVVLILTRRRIALLETIIGTILVLSLGLGLLSGVTLMMGCGLAVLLRRGWQWHRIGADRASILALLLVVVGLALNLRDWPRFLPAFGTAVLLTTGPASWGNRKMLAGIGLPLLGTLAHPLYLWLGPLVALVFIHGTAIPSHAARLGALGLALMAAIATHWLVERPMRRPNRSDDNTSGNRTIRTAAATAFVGALGLACYLSNGLPGTGFRDPARQSFFDSLQKKTDSGDSVGCTEACTERDPRRPHAVLLWGDAHARELHVGLRQNLPPDWQILQVSQPGCLPDVRVTEPSTTDPCAQSNWRALQTVAAAKPEVVIVAQDRGQLIRVYNATSATLARLGVTRTLFVGPTPHWRADLPVLLARHFWPDFPRRTPIGLESGVQNLNNILIEHFPTTDTQAFVDVIGTFCTRDGCLTRLGNDSRGGLTSADRSHLSPIASDYLAREVLARMVVGSLRK